MAKTSAERKRDVDARRKRVMEIVRWMLNAGTIQDGPMRDELVVLTSVNPNGGRPRKVDAATVAAHNARNQQE